MKPSDPSAPGLVSFTRAFRPFFLAVAISAVLLARDFHLKNVSTTAVSADVRMEGRPLGNQARVQVDGHKLVSLDTPVGIGWKKFIFSAPDAEPEERECFVWYGGIKLGVIDLQRSRGKLEFTVVPPSLKYSLHSDLGHFTSPAGFFAQIPAGEYLAEFFYSDELVPSQRVRVVGNETSKIRITNEVGGVEIVSDRDGVEFTLHHTQGKGDWGGRLPFSKPFLASGAYRLEAHHGYYALNRILTVLPGETNRVSLEFVYGGMSVESDPAGATVTVDDVERGTTPLIVKDLIPGKHSVTLAKPGFDPVPLRVTIDGTNIAVVNLPLVNTRYRIAISEAAAARKAGRYQAALQSLEQALEAQPNDPVAVPLLLPTKAAAFREECGYWLDREDLAKAEQALTQAVAIEPDSKELPDLKARIEQLKQRREQDRVAGERRQAQANADRALQNARTLIRSEKFAEAEVQLGEARKWMTDHPEIAVVERESKEAQAARERRILGEQIQSRRRELNEAMEFACRSDEHRPVASLVWLTTKSARQVEFACEPKDGKGMKVYDVSSPKDYLSTWRNGSLVPLLNVGTYLRLGAVTLTPDTTEIQVRIYSIHAEDNRLGPDTNSDRNNRLVQSAFQSLSKALDGDLKMK